MCDNDGLNYLLKPFDFRSAEVFNDPLFFLWRNIRVVRLFVQPGAVGEKRVCDLSVE